MEKLLLKPVEVAEILGVSRTTAYDLIRSGDLPAIRVRGHLRVPLASVRQWVEGKTGADHTSAKDSPEGRAETDR